MGVRDILLQANSYPRPTPDWAIERAAGLAAAFGARLSLALCQVHIPPASNWLADRLLDAGSLIAAENRKSDANVQALLSAFAEKVPADCRGESFRVHCSAMVTHWQLAIRARSRDLTVVPVYDHPDSVSVAEGLVFESGRPVLLLPESAGKDGAFDRIAVAWDGSGVAARALADALPFCRRAASVALVQVMGEKDLSDAAPLADMARNLRLHDIEAEPVEIELQGRDAAATLQGFCERDGRDLLVMGAFGHSRMREFVLGGVTRSVLHAPALPVLVSH